MFDIKSILGMMGLKLTDDDITGIETIINLMSEHQNDIKFFVENIKEISEGMIYFKSWIKEQQK